MSVRSLHVLTFIFLLIGCNAYAVTPEENPAQPQVFETDRSVFEYIDRRREAFRNVGLIVICTNWALDPVKILAAAKPYFGDVKILMNPKKIPSTDKKIHFLYFGGEGSVLNLNECLSNFPKEQRTANEVVAELHEDMKIPREYNLGSKGLFNLLPSTIRKYSYGSGWVATYFASTSSNSEREKTAIATIFGLDSQVCVTTSFCNYLP